MEYLFLLYGDETQGEEPPKDPEAFAAFIKPWADYGAAMAEAGVMRGGNALMPTATATTVSAHGGGEPNCTDGPFAETKEQLGGYYLVDCPDLDTALAWAAKCPAAKDGHVEVRPIMPTAAPGE